MGLNLILNSVRHGPRFPFFGSWNDIVRESTTLNLKDTENALLTAYGQYNNNTTHDALSTQSPKAPNRALCSTTLAAYFELLTTASAHRIVVGKKFVLASARMLQMVVFLISIIVIMPPFYWTRAALAYADRINYLFSTFRRIQWPIHLVRLSLASYEVAARCVPTRRECWLECGSVKN